MIRPLLITALLCLMHTDSSALIVAGSSNTPIEDRGWPAGTLDVANLPSRLGRLEGPPFGGGLYQFFYRSKNTDEFNQALKAFAKIRTPVLELVIHEGPENTHWLERKDKPDTDTRIDWTFTVWVPEKWHKLYNDPRSTCFSDDPNFRKPVAPPRIDLYVGGGNIVWKDVNIPDGLRMIDKRAESASVKTAGGGLIRATVYDMATGKTIPDAQVALAQYQPSRNWKEVLTAETDHLGNVQIDKIPSGHYAVRIRAEGFASRTQGSYHNRRNTYYEFDVELSKQAAIAGTVVDASGVPVKNATVSAYGPIGIDGRGYPCFDVAPATTDDKGRFKITSLPTGFTMLGCGAEGLTRTPGRTFDIYAVPSQNVELTMTAVGAIRGRVLDKTGNADFDKIHVHIDAVDGPAGGWGRWGGSARCKPDGTFEFNKVPPGKYAVRTTPRTRIDRPDPRGKIIRVESRKTTEVEITHHPRQPRPKKTRKTPATPPI